MNKKLVLQITTITSVLFGVFFFFLLYTTASDRQIQYGLLGFIIGFPIVWLIYLAIWFINKGISKTAFPAQASFIINGIKKLFNISLTVYQEKMLVEMTGTFIMISFALALAVAFFTVTAGILFIVGRLHW